jgi:predicted nucleic acid-binding protein
MTAFFDSSAIIALVDPDHQNHEWALSQLMSQKEEGPIIINNIVYAEFSVAMPDQPAVDAVISRYGIERSMTDDTALFMAGKRYKLYKHKGSGPKLNVLPDFFVGADAVSLGIPLVTANPKDFRSFFSGLKIIHPGGEDIVP